MFSFPFEFADTIVFANDNGADVTPLNKLDVNGTNVDVIQLLDGLLAVTFALVCLTLAIRIKGRILLSWIMVLSKYNARPRYYVYNKNDIHLRTTTNEQTNAPSKQSVKKKSTIKPNKIKLPMKKMVWAEEVAINPSAQLEFRTTKKGDLRVYIQEIK